MLHTLLPHRPFTDVSTALGSHTSCHALQRIRRLRSARHLQRNSRDLLSIGPSLALLLQRNMLQNGLSAGERPAKNVCASLTQWSCDRIPFYWELKTIFLLFLSLPQTQVRVILSSYHPQLMFYVIGLDLHLQRLSATFLRQK